MIDTLRFFFIAADIFKDIQAPEASSKHNIYHSEKLCNTEGQKISQTITSKSKGIGWEISQIGTW